MNCWPSSEVLAHSGRAALLGLALGAVLLVTAGCGDDSSPETPRQTRSSPGPSDGQSPPETPPGTSAARPPLSPGPAVPEDFAIAEDELVIEDGDLDAVERAVVANGGEVASVVEEIGVTTARFDVADREELLRIRDELRAQGFDATVTPLLGDPNLSTDPTS